MTRRRKHLISRAEFARRAGRGRSTITEACAGPLRAACVANRIDAAHAASRAWAESRGIDPAQLLRAPGAPAAAPNRRAPKRPPDPIAPDLIAALPIEGLLHDGHQVWAMPWQADATEHVIGTLEEVLAAADERLQRLVYHCDGELECLIDLDHAAVEAFVTQQRGRPCTPEDLDRLWSEELRARASESAA